MRIWIDLVNSPHVLFFRPIIQELQTRGHETLITTRYFAETVPLADRYGLHHTTLGFHGGKSVWGKATALIRHVLKQIVFIRGQGVDLAVSHNSYMQALTARCLNIPLVTIMDYEHQPANHISFRLAKRVLVPKTFSEEALRKYGASLARSARYNSIKEDVYLADFVPDPTFLATLGISPEKILVAMRPPALAATYHRFENPFFDELLAHVLAHPDTYVILLPRTPDQHQRYGEMRYPNLLVPIQPLDGPNLIYHSDLVISAGGTMNREATVLGTPVYTVFKGTMGNVDQYLIQTGKMVQISEPADVPKIVLEKKALGTTPVSRSQILEEIVEKILEVASF
jgi:predicted glycosyltransferase